MEIVHSNPDFAAKARESFEFLQTQWGLVCAHAESGLVRYESDAVIVEVFHDTRTLELGVTVGLRRLLEQAPPEPDIAPPTIGRPVVDGTYSLDDIIRYAGGGDECVPLWGSAFAASQDQMDKWLPRLAETLRQVGQPFLRGEEPAFHELGRARLRAAQLFAANEHLRTSRIRANEAWRARDYGAVIAALESMEGRLTPSEMKKLSYARDKRGRSESQI